MSFPNSISPLRLDLFHPLLKELQKLETQVHSDCEKNVSLGAWKETKEKLHALYRKYDTVMSAVEKNSAKGLFGRTSTFENHWLNQGHETGQENQLVLFQPAESNPSLIQRMNLKTDFGFFQKYLNIKNTVSCQIKMHEFSHQKAIDILYRWDVGFKFDRDLSARTKKIICELEKQLVNGYFKKAGVDEIICAIQNVRGLLELLSQEVDFYEDSTIPFLQLKRINDELGTMLANRMDEYEKTNFSEIVEEKIGFLTQKAKEIYWYEGTGDLGALRVEIQTCLFSLAACQDLLSNGESDPNKQSGLKTKISKIQHKLVTAYRYLLPSLIMGQMREKLASERGLSSQSTDFCDLKELMHALGTHDFQSTKDTFFNKIGCNGYLTRWNPLNSSPLMLTALPEHEGQRWKNTDVEILAAIPVSKNELQWEEKIDPRLEIMQKKLRSEKAGGKLSFEKLKKYQSNLDSHFHDSPSRATEKAAIQFSYEINMCYLGLLAKHPLIQAKPSEVESIENLILNKEGHSTLQCQASMRIAQEMLVVHFLAELCRCGSNEPTVDTPLGTLHNSPKPYFSQQNENRPESRAAIELNAYTTLVYQQMSYLFNLEEGEADGFFQGPINGIERLMNPKEEYTPFHKLADCGTFVYNEFQLSDKDALRKYLDGIRERQIKNNLGDIGFYIKICGQKNPIPHHIAVKLHMSAGPLTEINLLNPYNSNEHAVSFGNTQQMNNYFPALLKGLLLNEKSIEVSFVPFCNQEAYRLSTVAAPSSAPQHLEVMRFPRGSHRGTVAVRGNIPGVLNWNDNRPLRTENGDYVFEIPHGEYSRGDLQYKFVLLIDGRKEAVWEDFKGNRDLSKSSPSSPYFRY